MNDDELNKIYWQQIREGNKQALFELYNNTYFHLVRFGLKIIADEELVKDCVMELFLKLWDKHTRLNPVEQVRAYLFTSIRRMLLDMQSYETKTGTAITKFYGKNELEELSYEEIIIQVQHDKELKHKLSRAMEQLTPKQKELIRLKFFEGLSYEEVALQASQNVKTTYNTIYNAIQVLRRILK